MRVKSFLLLVIVAGSLLAGCAVPSPGERARISDSLAAQANWRSVRLHTPEFTLAAYVPAQMLANKDTLPTDTSMHASVTLTVYIEGDGLAWITRSQVSLDPTPNEPTALKLALRHPDNAVAYLARPCQYVSGPDARNCSNAYWTDQRFAADVVASMNDAVDRLKAHAGAQRVSLVGFSGGGAIAALVAARRSDMRMLITVAGNLDTMAWTRHHGLAPLKGSLNPADEWRSLQRVRQIHFVGSEDSVVPEQVIRSYLDRFPAGFRPEVRVVQGHDHHCCWERQWVNLVERSNDALNSLSK